ncbi:PucR family transcriptional regulator [Arthrobacter crusticola]|uniref:PucR family transcriptional regulator n=1 Tax=Arthrobacter crusticola TaxID=2547960 RepID=A0A4R5TWM5_9MICC|nr:PucR family transcriptional regulator [Arthrobacter crusticola]TDK25557.1 PucR family transcriptional regulator [Arthrobacter crusticola]
MAISLADLLAVSSLRLEPAGGAPASDTPIGWVAVTELEDPLPFLSGGEVVLTTGVRQTTPAAQRRFVRRVSEAGGLAVGFGVGLSHQRIPPALLEEARRVELPVFEVPYETPFIAIGKIVADSLSAEHYSRLEDLLRGHQVLAAALLGGGGMSRLLEELAGMLGTDVALFQYGTRIAGGRAPAGMVPAGTDRSWHRVPVATGLKDRCTLVIAEPYAPAAIVDYAQSLISVELSNQARRRAGERVTAGQLLQDIVRGALAGPDAVARLGSTGLDCTGRHVVVAVEVASGQRKALRTLPLPEDCAGVLTALLDDRLLVLAPEPDGAGLGTRLGAYLHAAGFTARVGIGGAYAQPNGLRWSYFEARESLTRGGPVNPPNRLSLTSLLLSSEDVPLADLAAEALSPLADFDAKHGGGLITTLERYLALNGSVAAVADALQLHRNTVRYRLQQIADLTGFDPAVTADRVHLYLALNVRALR